MYSYIKGELSEIVAENHIVVENGGIGYNIYIPGQVLSLLPGVGEEVKSILIFVSERMHLFYMAFLPEMI